MCPITDPGTGEHLPPHGGRYQIIPNADCLEKHRAVIDEHGRIAAERGSQAANLREDIVTWSDRIRGLGIEIEERRARRGLHVAHERSLQDVKAQHLATREALMRIRALLFSSNADLFREVLSYLEQTEADLAARTSELNAELATMTDPDARIDMKLRIEKLEMIRVLRGRVPPGVAFSTFLAQAVAAPEGDSPIQEEDRIFLRTIVASEQDTNVALALLNAEIQSLAKIIGVLETQILQKQADMIALDREVERKQGEISRLQQAVQEAGVRIDGLVAEAGAATTVANEALAFINAGKCNEIVWVDT